MTAAYLIGAIKIHDPEEYALYRADIPTILAGYDVEYLSVDGHPEMLEGTQPAPHQFIIKFPSMEKIKEFYASEPYQRIISHRHKSSDAVFIMAMHGFS